MRNRLPQTRSFHRGMVAFAVVSCAVLIADTGGGIMGPVRTAFLLLLTPIIYVEQGVRSVDALADEILLEPGARVAERRALNREIASLRTQKREIDIRKTENRRLRELLGGVERLDTDVVVANVIALTAGPVGSLLTIDVGESQSVRVGDPVIDGGGLCGQVVTTGLSTSQVLIVTDPAHSVPVVIERTGVQGIAAGTGSNGLIEFEDDSILTDVQIGDVMMTSGLGGRFPYGYPVAEVISFTLDDPLRGRRIFAEPFADPVARRQIAVLRSGGE